MGWYHVNKYRATRENRSELAPVRKLQSNLVNVGTEGTIESVHIKQVEFRENVWAFFPRGQSKLSIITGCPY